MPDVAEIQAKLNEVVALEPEQRAFLMRQLEVDVETAIRPGRNRLNYFSHKFDPKSFVTYVPSRKEIWLDLTVIGQKDGEDGWSDKPGKTNPRIPRRTQLLDHVGRKVHIVEHDWDESYTELIQILQGMSSQIGVHTIVIPSANEDEERIAQKMGFKKVVKSVDFHGEQFVTTQECYVWEVGSSMKQASVKLRRRERHRNQTPPKT